MRPPSSVSGSGRSSRPSRKSGGAKNERPSNNRRKPSGPPRHGAERKPREDSRPRRIFDNPPLPEDLDIKALPSKVKTGLRALSPENAEIVGKEILMVIRFLEAADSDSGSNSDVDNLSQAARYAKSAVARAGRVGVVREYAGRIALKQGNFQEAKTTLRAAHRILGEDCLLIDIAAAELGLGRASKALEVLGEIDSAKIERERLIEARVLSARARVITGQADAAMVSLIEKDRQYLLERTQNQQFRAESERILRQWDQVRSEIDRIKGKPS